MIEVSVVSGTSRIAEESKLVVDGRKGSGSLSKVQNTCTIRSVQQIVDDKILAATPISIHLEERSSVTE
jgi:hypothetical protein